MKKIVCFLLIAVYIFSLSACVSKTEPTFSTSATEITDSEVLAPEKDAVAEVSVESAYETPEICISELMVKNASTIMDESGNFSDWFELHNYSEDNIDITGWIAENSNGSFVFPSCVVPSGGYLLIWADNKSSCSADEIHTGFSLADNDEFSLYTDDGNLADSVSIPSMKSDRVFVLNENGEFSASTFATPGYPNTDQGYVDYMESKPDSSTLMINEVVTGNTGSSQLATGKLPDWVEIKNNSGAEIDLSGYYLSDDLSDLTKWQFPSETISAGGLAIVYCDDSEETYDLYGNIHSNFSLSMTSERLYISDGINIIDYMYVHDIPVNGSMGHIDGHCGYFYFEVPSVFENNSSSGCRFVSDPVVLSSSEGVFNDVESVPVELSGPGTVYYTTDGSVPTTASSVYTGTFTVSRTTIVRAINVEDGRLPSEVSTYSYIINENHVLPVVSLVTDNHSSYKAMYNNGNKEMEVSGVFTLFETDGASVTNRCGIVLAGAGTAYKMPKKSLSVIFREKYGDGDLEYSVFGTELSRYSGLTLRAGEAFCTSIIRSDLFQDLALQIDDCAAITQHSKFCILYVDGEYFGIMTLKEKFTEEYFADTVGISDPDTVTIVKYPVAPYSDFYNEVIAYCMNNDMSTDENFQYFCRVVNIDSFIDWLLLEGYSGNPDIGDNLRFMKSTETGQWYFALYDLDWAFQDTSLCFTNLVEGSDYQVGQLKTILNPLIKNETFVDMVATRYSQIWDNVLSNENVLSMYDYYQDLLTDEVARDRDLWGNSKEVWEIHMDRLRDFVRDNDVQNVALDQLCKLLCLTQEQRAYYFG